jgi:NADPH:quinone reductase-like Zn-dependent oxidoreductase
VGLAAAAIAKNFGALVASTTRKPDREAMLRANGADDVFIDTGSIGAKVAALGGVDKVLELIGAATLEDSLRCARPRGIVCMTGIVGNQWALRDFSPMSAIPTSVCLTAYSGGANEFMAAPLQSLVDQIETGAMRVPTGRVFTMDQIVEAHRVMDANAAGGKIGVLT